MVLSALLLMVSNKASAFIENKATTFIEGKLELVLSTDIKKEAEKLQSTLSTIKAVLDDAEEKQATATALVLWLSKLKDAAYDADNLLDEFKLNALEKTQDDGDHNWIMEKILLLVTCCSDQVIFRYRMAHGIRGITERFDSLDKERSVFNLRVAKPTTDARPPTHSYFLESEVVGRAEDVNKIVERLIGEGKNTSVTVLPIVGMGGLGKTTLAQIVFNDSRVREHFELLVWSFAAHNFSVEKIAKDMIETSTESGFALSDLDYMVRNLRKLVGVKRYLLVVDDLWSKDRNLWDLVKIL